MFNKRSEENKRKIGQERSSTTTNVIGPLHECKKLSPIPKALHRQSRKDQARSEKEEKRDRKDRGQEADGKKGSPTKTHRSN